MTKVHLICGGYKEWDKVIRKILTTDEILETYPYFVEVDGNSGVYHSYVRYAAVAVGGRLRSAKRITSLEHNGISWVDGRFRWVR